MGVMEPKQLNQKLIKRFPELNKKFCEETEWQEGEETGSHVVYGDVFAPYIESVIAQQNDAEMEKIFAFIEDILLENDGYSEEVIMFSVLERLLSDKDNYEKCKQYFGEKTETVCKEMQRGYTTITKDNEKEQKMRFPGTYIT